MQETQTGPCSCDEEVAKQASTCRKLIQDLRLNLQKDQHALICLFSQVFGYVSRPTANECQAMMLPRGASFFVIEEEPSVAVAGTLTSPSCIHEVMNFFSLLAVMYTLLVRCRLKRATEVDLHQCLSQFLLCCTFEASCVKST